MQRNVNQLRPKGDPSAAPYAPQRDIANIYTPMLREVFAGLDEKNWTPFFKAWFDREGITEDQLAKAVMVFSEAHSLFIRDREVETPADAFDAAGASADLPDAVKYALFCRLGEVLTGGFFVALRDVTMQGYPSPVQSDLAAMIAAGRGLSCRISGKLASYTVGELESKTAELDEMQRVVAQLQAQVADLKTKGIDAERMQATWKASFQRLDAKFTPVRLAQRPNFVVRLFTAVRIAWLVYWKRLL